MGQFFKVGLGIGLGVQTSKFIAAFVAGVIHAALQDTEDEFQGEDEDNSFEETLEPEEAAEE